MNEMDKLIGKYLKEKTTCKEEKILLEKLLTFYNEFLVRRRNGRL